MQGLTTSTCRSRKNVHNKAITHMNMSEFNLWNFNNECLNGEMTQVHDTVYSTTSGSMMAINVHLCYSPDFMFW